jgi:uncharacterized protein
MTIGPIVVAVLVGLSVVDLLLASRAAGRLLPRWSRRTDGAVRGPLAWGLAGLVRLYRAGWSGRNAGMCRFEPSCSAYALAAVHRHGGVLGGALAVRRLLRCQPFSAGGYDPVPGTDPSPGIVREPEGMTAVPGGPTSDGQAPGDEAAAAVPVHKHGSSSPSQGARAEIVGSGRGPWV